MFPQLLTELKTLANPAKALSFKRYFKAKPGEYAAGDQFLGLTVPQVRTVAKKYSSLGFTDLKKLLTSKIHEQRLVALLILVIQFSKGDRHKQSQIYKFYLANTAGINNWDLIDLSAPRIVGAYLGDKTDRVILYRLAKDKSLWHNRIAMLSCFYFIRQKDFTDALKIAEVLLNHQHDLIHKAVGWMLREIGKIDLAAEEKFLKKYARTMPRTMLRYAIERFPETKRQDYLKAKLEAPKFKSEYRNPKS